MRCGLRYMYIYGKEAWQEVHLTILSIANAIIKKRQYISFHFLASSRLWRYLNRRSGLVSSVCHQWSILSYWSIVVSVAFSGVLKFQEHQSHFFSGKNISTTITRNLTTFLSFITIFSSGLPRDTRDVPLRFGPAFPETSTNYGYMGILFKISSYWSFMNTSWRHG